MRRLALLCSLALLAACSTQQADPDASHSAVEATRGQLNYKLASGNYKCAQGHRLNMQRHAKNQDMLHLNWNGDRYQLKRDPSFSGLPRYEDAQKQLVWIELPWKGVLLDSETQKPLANECKTA